MRALAELPPRSSEDVRVGTLRSQDLDAFSAILDAVGSGPVMVTGAGELPAMVAAGLASAAAALGTRTALLECDLASPSLAASLGLSPAPGLAEYVRHEAEAPELLQPLVLAGPASAKARTPLVCIVAGSSASPGTGTPLDGEEFAHAVGRLRDGYQLVVLRGPPLEKDPAVLRTVASQADSLIACVDAPAAAGFSGRRLRKALRRLPARSAGVVICG